MEKEKIKKIKKNRNMETSKLYVGNLPYAITDDQLAELFKKAGEVTSAKVITDKFSGRSKGFGFVEMASGKEAKKAIDEMNGQMIEGRPIVVNEARPMQERPSRSSY